MKCSVLVFSLVSIHLIQIVPSCSSDLNHGSISFDGDSLELNNFSSSKINEQFENEKKTNVSSAVTQDDFRSIKNNDVTNINTEIPWYFRIPVLPITFATSPTLPEGKCKRHVQKYLAELNKGTLWAVRMFDSSTKYPEGIITGHTRHYGNFDECYNIETIIQDPLSEQDADVVGGKYCFLKIEYHKLNSSSDHNGPYTLEVDVNESVWEMIKEKGDFRRVKRYLLELALCVPDSCSEEDIETALVEPLKKIGIEQKLLIKAGIKGKCQARKSSPEFSSWAEIYCCVILGLFLLVMVGTWYDSTLKGDEKEENAALFVDILLCFSARRNIKSITEYTSSHQGLDSIFFFRFLFMCFIVMAHRLVQFYTNPMINSEYLEYTYTLPSMILLYNGPMIVEGFFAIGGILLSYHLLLELDKKKRINFIAAILIRYLRLTPSYLLVIFFIGLILPHIGSGPYWEYKIGLESNSCADNWWANILYINNYVNPDKLCIFQSWYISVDFHLYIIGLFVVYIFWKMPRSVGYPFLILLILMGCSIPFYLTYFLDVQPIYRGLPYMHEVREDPYFTGHYIKTHERLATYFVGILGGAIIYDHSLSPWSIPKPWSQLPLIPLAMTAGVTNLFMGLKYYDPNANPTPLETALYACLSKPVFALVAISVVILMSVSDSSEFHHKIFKPRWAQPLARLTFGVYLIHNIVQSYDIGVVRTPRTFSTYNAIWDVIPDIVFSFLLSLIISLLVEGPFRRIEKRLLTKRTHKRKSVKQNDTQLMKKTN